MARAGVVLVALVLSAACARPDGGTTRARSGEISQPTSARADARIAPQGSAVLEEYAYDGAGNIARIGDASAAGLAVRAFSPEGGVVGQQVTIQGAGFDVAPGKNTVRLGGVPAVVRDSTPTRLTVTVPEGAVTGPISVTVGGSTASSETSFVVSAPAVIAGFSPSVGKAGTVVTITGSGFAPLPASDAVTIGGGAAAVSSASAETLAVTVGPGSASGKIVVTTPFSSATSAADFYVMPGTRAAADAAFTARAVLGSPTTVVISEAGRAGIVAFDGTAGQHLTLMATGATLPSTTKVTVYDPAGAAIQVNQVVSGQSHKFVLPDLLRSGTYSLLVEPSSTSTGSLSLTLFQDVELRLDPRGGPVGMALAPGQNGRCILGGKAGDTFTVAFTPFSTSPQGKAIALGFSTPGGTTAIGPNLSSAGIWRLPTFTESGDHVLTIRPAGVTGASLTLLASSPAPGTLLPDGPVVRFQSSRPGQEGRYTFEAIAGQSLTLRATTDASTSVEVRVYAPDGALLLQDDLAAGIDVKLDLSKVPLTGEYSVTIATASLGASAVDLRLLSQDVGPVELDGAARSVSLSAGRNGRYTFQAGTGDYVEVAALLLSSTPVTFTQLTVLSPSGARLKSVNLQAQASFETPALTESGTFELAVQPSGTAAAAMTLVLSRSVRGSVTVDGALTDASITRAGQVGRYTFDGVAGQNLTLRARAGSTFPGGIGLSVVAPGGGKTGTTLSNGGDLKLELNALTSSGTYTVLVAPQKLETGTVDLHLLGPATETLLIEAPPRLLALIAGQNGRYSFDANAGDLLNVVLGSVSTTPAGKVVSLQCYRPDGTLLGSTSATAAKSWSLSALPLSGSYTIKVSPSGATAANFSLQLVRR